MSFGTPMGSARIAAVPTAVPPPPPIETMPSIRPSRWSRAATSAAPRAITAMASPRSFRARSDGEVGATGAGDLVGGDVGREKRLAENADVDHERRDARRLDPRLEIRELDALGVERTDDGNDLRSFSPACPEYTSSRPSGAKG